MRNVYETMRTIYETVLPNEDIIRIELADNEDLISRWYRNGKIFQRSLMATNGYLCFDNYQQDSGMIYLFQYKRSQIELKVDTNHLEPDFRVIEIFVNEDNGDRLIFYTSFTVTHKFAELVEKWWNGSKENPLLKFSDIIETSIEEGSST